MDAVTDNVKCRFLKWNFVVNQSIIVSLLNETTNCTGCSWSFLTHRVIWRGSIISSPTTVSDVWDVEKLGECKTQW